jgi:predicted HicB family RNase H-like nuclease
MAKEKRYPVTKGGTELTPEVLDAISKEAEEGYDLSKARPRHLGRPSLSDAGISPRITVRLPGEVYEAARLKAAERGETLSELAREAIRTYVTT